MKSATYEIKGPPLLKFFRKTSVFPAFHFHDLMCEYGDVVRCGSFFYLINHPDLAKKILNKDQKDFNQEDFIGKRTRTVFGLGMVTSKGEIWESERRLLNPVFNSKNIHKSMAETIVEIDKELENWKPLLKTGKTFDIADKMGDMAITTAGRILFDTDLSEKKEEIKRVVKIGTKYIVDGIPFFIPYWLPTPWNIRLRIIRRQIDNILNPIVNERISSKPEKKDFSQVLINALTGPEDRRLMLDEMKTMLAGGYFPISCSLSMFWHVIGQHPDYLLKVKKEIRQLPVNYEFTEHFYNDFPITTAAIFEAMRLYPVAFSIWRKSKVECSIDGLVIPKGKTVCISLFNLHRNPKFWDDPDSFNPERFNEMESKKRPKHHFMPFGWGSRKCIGDHYAMMTIFLTIIRSLQKYDINILPGQKLDVKSAALICPKKVDAKISLITET
ncbi:MAG: cytochrome P450 [Gillisia sp.]|nr:cytochrome P450 [Gillisia sp.]